MLPNYNTRWERTRAVLKGVSLAIARDEESPHAAVFVKDPAALLIFREVNKSSVLGWCWQLFLAQNPERMSRRASWRAFGDSLAIARLIIVSLSLSSLFKRRHTRNAHRVDACVYRARSSPTFSCGLVPNCGDGNIAAWHMPRIWPLRHSRLMGACVPHHSDDSFEQKIMIRFYW